MPVTAAFCGFLAGVAAIVWWIFVRFPRAAPRTRSGVAGWFCTALAATALAPFSFAPLSAVVGPLAAFLVVVLPSGICVMLAAAWTIRFVTEAIKTGR